MTALGFNGRHSVGDNANGRGDTVLRSENVHGSLRHYDHLVAEISDRTYGLPLRLRWTRKDCMQCRYYRLGQLLQKQAQVIFVPTLRPLTPGKRRLAPNAIQAKLVLNVDGIGIRGIDRVRNRAVTFLVTLLNSPADLGAVRTQHVGLVNGCNATRGGGIRGTYRRDQISGKGRNTTSTRNGGRDEDYAYASDNTLGGPRRMIRRWCEHD